MLILSQCGTGIFNADSLSGAWLKSYNDKQFLLKARVDSYDVILGVFDSKDTALNAFNDLVDQLKLHWKARVYQIGGI